MRFLHMADLHLDTPFRSADAAARRMALREAFSAILRLTAEKQCDLLVIAGDLFDGISSTAHSTVSFVYDELARIAPCQVVIAPGNHDPYEKGSIWDYAPLPKNVFLFRSEQLSKISFEDYDVYGYAFESDTLDHCPFSGFQAPPDRTAILVAHGDLGAPLSPDCPIAESDLSQSGFSYVALGHIHRRSDPVTVRNTTYAYAGCPYGRDFGETGEKGVYLVDITSFGVTSEFYPIANHRYAVETISADGMHSLSEAGDAIAAKIAAHGYGEHTRLRVVLTGNVSPSFTLSERLLVARFPNLAQLQVEDRTLPLYDTRTLSQDIGIRGEFFRTLLPDLEGGTAESREVASAALKLGLRALAGEDPADILSEGG